MLIPWPLVLSLVVAAGVGALVARLSRHHVRVIADAIAGVAVPALIAARLAIIARDAVLSGGFPPPLAWVNITAGLSLPVGLVVALLALTRQLRGRSATEDVPSRDGGPAAAEDVPSRGDPAAAEHVPSRRDPPAVERGLVPVVAVTAAWAGLIAFATLSVVRGDALGISAPPPLGIVWPGEAGTAVPVGLLEALSLGAGLWWAWPRYRDDGMRLGASLVATMAAIQLVGGVLRPSLATPDRDLDALLGVAALALAIAVVRRVPARRLGVAMAAVTMFVGVLAVGSLTGGGTVAGSGEVAADPTGSLAGAMVAGTTPDSVPGWGGPELTAFAAADGGPVVVNLWASWCPPCHAEAPAVARAARALEGEVTIIGVLVDDDPARAQGFIDRYDLPFATVIDEGITAAVGSPGLPTTVVVGANGQVLERAVGGVDDRSLAAMLERAEGR